MKYLLSESEYERLLARSNAVDEIDKIINERPQDDEHGNSVIYAYRFDKTISNIMDVLDKVRDEERREWVAPWVVAK